MPYARSTLTALFDGAMADITSADIGADGMLRFAVLRVLARVLAGLAYLHYDYQDWIARQAVPWTATDEYLAGWAALRGLQQKDATAALFYATFSGTAGADIPAGTSVVRGDNATFTTQADVPFGTATSVSVVVLADVPGAAGNCDPGTQMALANPIARVQGNSGVAGSALIAGADMETAAAFQARVLAAFANQPAGGDRADYVQWAEAIAGVTRAWVIPTGMGPGTVIVYVMLDDAEAAFDGFPQGTNGVSPLDPRDTPATGDQLMVANAILPQQPVGALVYVCAPVAMPVACSVAGLGTANTLAMQTTISAALAGVLLAHGQVGGAINPASGAPFPPIDPSVFYAALQAIPNLPQFTLLAPATPVTPGPGQLPVLGPVSFPS